MDKEKVRELLKRNFDEKNSGLTLKYSRFKKPYIEVEVVVKREEQKKIKELLERIEEETGKYPHVKVKLKIT